MLLQMLAGDVASSPASEASTISCGAEMSYWASSRSRASMSSTRTRLINRMIPYGWATVSTAGVVEISTMPRSIGAQATIVKATIRQGSGGATLVRVRPLVGYDAG